jgi:biopolymer transport protein ExbD/biopolymer transport protein TolR
MARLGKKGSGRPKPAMNVTPLVDIVLVLLIIFMVVIPAMEQGITIELPSMLHADEDPETGVDPFTLAISSSGDMFFDDELVTPEDLEARLRAANDAEPERRIMLRGDYRVKYEHVRTLFKICQDIGFPGVSLRVNQPQDAAEPVAAR